MTTVDSSAFDTSQGTVYLVLGCGGTDANLDVFADDADTGQPRGKVITRANRPVPTSAPGVFTRPGADAVEDAIWSARRDSSTGYGIAVFDVEPGSITVTHYHAAGADPAVIGEAATGKPNPDYTPFETFRLVRPHRR